MSANGSPARPQLMRAMNEQLLLEHIRSADGVSRAELARISGLAKNTVSFALANLERANLVRPSGVRTGMPGPAAVLYEVRPEAGFVLGLDVGGQFLRGAVADVSGAVRSRSSVKTQGSTGHARVTELIALAESLANAAGIAMSDITQTVLGSPGVYDPRRDHLAFAGGLPGWEKPAVLAELRRFLGPTLMIENDVDAAALAEQAHGHGNGVDSFVFVSIGTGIGMGVVLDGRLHRGRHGAAGEIGFLPLHTDAAADDARDARRRGSLEAAASAAGVVRAARRAGATGRVSAQQVFAAAARGESWAERVVAEEAQLIARAICAVVTVIDPELVVLGGGIGRAAGFVDAVAVDLRRLAPVTPELKVSALGADAVVDGCLAAGLERAWVIVTAGIPTAAASEASASA
ncbi:MAG TPA: ROK family protein [Micromonosporaceae bacterium]|nr:ROK family protein [Micromonosporaceae bacterium]